jgi:hypothetical protein
VGRTCSLRLLGARRIDTNLGVANVVRTDHGEVALRFGGSPSPGLLQFMESLQQEWDQAREIAHSPECCTSRGALEPLVPRNLRVRA